MATVKERYFEDVDIGGELGPLEKKKGLKDVLRFLGVWGQGTEPGRFNSDEEAKKIGFPKAIVPGIMSEALLSQLITDWAPNVHLKTLDCVFRQPVLHDTAYQLKGVITDKNEEKGELELDVYIEGPDGLRPVGGKAIVALPRRGK